MSDTEEDSVCSASSLQFSFVDWLSLGGYFVVLVAVAWTAGKTHGASEENSFFLADKGVVWWMVACSLLMSNVGAEHFVGLCGTAASSGVAVALFEWFATGPIIFLATVMLPVYMKSSVSTTLGYLKLRYGECVRQSVVALSLVLYVLTKISATLYAGGLVLAVVSGSAVSPLFSVILLILLTLGYTAVGGLKAVVWTETLQTVVLFGGGLLVSIYALHEGGGLTNIQERMSPSVEAYPLPAPSWQEWAGDDLSGFCDSAQAVPDGTAAAGSGSSGDESSGSSGIPGWVQELCDSTRQLANGTLIFTDPDSGDVSRLDDDSLEGLYQSYCGGAEDGHAGGGTANDTSRATMGALWPGWAQVAAPYEGYDRLSLWRPVDDSTYPWTAMVFGLPTMAVWYWACDQVITQRSLAAANIAHGEIGTIGAAILKLLPPFLLVLPGLAARSLMAEDGLIPSFLPTKSIPPIVFDGAYPWLIGRVLPLHARGLVLAAVLASLMSSLASVFNSAGTVFALDVYSRCLCCRSMCERRCIACHDAVEGCGAACRPCCLGGQTGGAGPRADVPRGDAAGSGGLEGSSADDAGAPVPAKDERCGDAPGSPTGSGRTDLGQLVGGEGGAGHAVGSRSVELSNMSGAADSIATDGGISIEEEATGLMESAPSPGRAPIGRQIPRQESGKGKGKVAGAASVTQNHNSSGLYTQEIEMAELGHVSIGAGHERSQKEEGALFARRGNAEPGEGNSDSDAAAAAAALGLPLNPPEAVTVWVGRLAIVAIGVLSILWLPVIPLMGDQLFAYVQKPPSYFAGPVSAVFVWGALSSRVNNWGAIAGLSLGWGLGLLRFGGDVVIAATRDQGADDHHEGDTGAQASFFFRVHYMHFSALNFVAATVAMWTASVFTAPPEAAVLEKTTFKWGMASELLAEQMEEADREATRSTDEEKAYLQSRRYICGLPLVTARQWLSPAMGTVVVGGVIAVVALYWGDP